jgi:hypothetical protein
VAPIAMLRVFGIVIAHTCTSGIYIELKPDVFSLKKKIGVSHPLLAQSTLGMFWVRD